VVAASKDGSFDNFLEAGGEAGIETFVEANG
jgi:hypothetical protein